MSTQQQREKGRHDLDDKTLGEYLVKQIPGLKLPILSTKIGYGQSNPTYFVDDAAGVRYILRKKPSGTIISPVAHQVDREYRVLKALGTVNGFPVPKVMEFVKGRIITDPDLKTLPKEQRRPAWISLVETLAWLHSIDPDSIGLEGYGKKTGFYTRHCNTFSRIEAQQAKVKDIKTGKELGRAHPQFDEVVDYIRKNVPGDRASIVHGDYKFDNVILHPTEPRVIAILDWELSTIGNPLMDAVYVVGPYWNRASGVGKTGGPRDDQGGVAYDPENLAESGFPSEAELLDRYTKIAGWDPRKDKWEVAKVFHLMRVRDFVPNHAESITLMLGRLTNPQGATISHGIQARTISGQASSDFSHMYFENTKRGLEAALAKVKALKAVEPATSRL